MPSANKVAANRANASKSTGPRNTGTTRYNATRHGLSGKQIVIQGEDPAAYEALLDGLRQSYRPANTAESILVEEIAQTFWRLQRARFLEAENFTMLGAGADAVLPFNAYPEKFDTVRRYMTSIERAYHRAVAQLERTQALRAKQPPQPEDQEPMPAAVGFVSQNPENAAKPEQTPQLIVTNLPTPNPPPAGLTSSELSRMRQLPPSLH
jgi:hypothetical protein